MKRRDLERHLKAHEARLLREGGNHSFWGFNAERSTAVPRHREIDFRLVSTDKLYRLIGPDGREISSPVAGTLGGHRRNRIYGRLDCAGALRWIEKGHYVTQRVFFADEEAAVAAGYRPCARCVPDRYAAWKARAQRTDGGAARSRRRTRCPAL